MALKDRLRRLTRSSSTSSHTPLEHASTTPSPALSKTSSRINLSKTLTFSGRKADSAEKQREKALKRVEEWAKKDEAEWRMPTARRAGRKSQQHQDTLRAFAWGCGRKSGDGGGRKGSGWSGVSPGTSRINSVDGGAPSPTLKRVTSARNAETVVEE